MTFESLGRNYIARCFSRRKLLDVLALDQNWPDVVRESQEIVELALKGYLRIIGLEPPHHHDVGPFLLEYADRAVHFSASELAEIADISRRLRKEREMAFYGDVDLIPGEVYRELDGRNAIRDVDRILHLVQRV